MTQDGRGDTRSSDRLEILGDLHAEMMVFQSMSIRDLGRRGVRIETSFPLQLDSLHELRLTLNGRSVIVKGRVVHCQISDVDQELVRYQAGLEFVEPSEPVQNVIVEFIDAIRSGRSG